MRRIMIFLVCGWSFLWAQSEESLLISADNPLILLALFTLGIVGIIILFISSKELLKTKQLHEELVTRQREIEDGQINLLSNMSENIFKLTQETIENRNTILKNTKDRSLEHLLENLINSENTLLDRTNDLIGFLRIKSKKVKIINERFNLNNVLNEVAGLVGANHEGSKAELIFDIDHTVPRFLIGDSLHLGHILTNLLEFSLSQTSADEVRLNVTIFHTFEAKTELQFQIIDTGAGFDQTDIEKIFIPFYDEQSSEYIGLGRFVAHQLVELMGGEISVQSSRGKGTAFTFVLPIQVNNSEEKRNYRLPEKILTAKKVFIADSNHNVALSIKKMFAYFRHDVRVMTQEQFTAAKPKLEEFDIVILGEELFNSFVVEYCKTLQKNRDIKIISVGSMLRPLKSKIAEDVISRRIEMPINQERVFELIVDLYGVKEEQTAADVSGKAKEESDRELIYKMHIAETPNIKREQFIDFSGANILIVEDNLINQKVLVNILDKSGINLSLANNGEEAVMLITSGKKNFDLVLMDINMPVMDGYAATEYIRKTGKFDTLPIVSFTALVLDSEIEKMYHCGLNAFLPKPINIGKLYTAFERYIGTNKKAVSLRDTLSAKEVKIDGLDIGKGIKYAGGNEAMYIEILREFLVAYGKSGELVSRLVRENRNEQLKMLCLDLKGLTATIGGYKLYDVADKIHKIFIYKDLSLLPKYAQEYEVELERLKGSIRTYIDKK